MIKGYIIDMDGTLLDSMHLWKNLATMWLLKRGIIDNEELKDILAPLSIDEAINYLKNKYCFNETAVEIQHELFKILEYHYLNEVNLKPGVRKFIQQCVLLNKRICLLTANHRDLTIKILTKHNLINYFNKIITCDDTILTKQNFAIYNLAAQQLNLKNNECIVIEDALHAICSAKKAGFIVWGVADQSNQLDWQKIETISDLSFENMKFMEVV